MTFFFKTVTILFLFEVLIFHSVFAADLNSDLIINVIDIVTLVNIILS